MVDFRGLNELDLNPMLSHISPNLRVLDISLNDNTSTINCAWDYALSQLQCLQSLSISFSNCSEILANTLNQISPSVNCLPGLKYTAINLENIEFSPEIYQAIDHFYLAIQDVREHSFGLQDSIHAGVQLDTLCQAVKHLNNLRFLKFMVYLRNKTDVDCIGKVVSDMHLLEKLNLHIRVDVHETMPFDLSLDNLTKLDHLRIELLFRPPEGFIEQLNMGITQLSALEHLELNILYYSKIRYPMFKSLLSRLNTLKALKDLEMSVNVEDENINESLSQKNFKLKREFNDLLQKHPALTRIMYHHFVSYICCTK